MFTSALDLKFNNLFNKWRNMQVITGKCIFALVWGKEMTHCVTLGYQSAFQK